MNTITAPSAAERAIGILGGPANAARLLSVKGHQNVQYWLKNRVPAEYCLAIERETRAKAAADGDPTLIVTCEELRPDLHWAVLRENAA